MATSNKKVNMVWIREQQFLRHEVFEFFDPFQVKITNLNSFLELNELPQNPCNSSLNSWCESLNPNPKFPAVPPLTKQVRHAGLWEVAGIFDAAAPLRSYDVVGLVSLQVLKVLEYGFPSQKGLKIWGPSEFYVIYHPKKVSLVMGLLLGLPSHFPAILSMTDMGWYGKR